MDAERRKKEEAAATLARIQRDEALQREQQAREAPAPAFQTAKNEEEEEEEPSLEVKKKTEQTGISLQMVAGIVISAVVVAAVVKFVYYKK